MVILLGLQITKIKVDTDPENMLPHDHPGRLVHDSVKKMFGLSDMIVVGLVNDRTAAGVFTPKNLTAIVHLTEYVTKIDGVVVKDLMSLANVDDIRQGEAGEIRFQWLMRQSPETNDAARSVLNSVRNLPLLNNTLASEDGKAAALYIPIIAKDQSYRISGEISHYLRSLDIDGEFYITGLPVAEDTFGVEMFIQMAISAPAAAAMIFLLMWFFFRSATLITAPMLMAFIVVIATMGLLIGSGYTVHIMSSMIPIFLMPIAVVDSVHILSEFADRYRQGDDPKVVVKQVMGHLFQPMLYTSITSAIGFASLAITPIPPVQVFGLHIAFGIALAFLLTITFIPAYIVSMNETQLNRMAEKVNQLHHSGRMPKLLQSVGTKVVSKTVWIISAIVIVVGTSLYGVSQIKINDNPVRWFAENHDIRVADRVMNTHFAGTYQVYLRLKHEPEVNDSKQLIQDVGQQLESLDNDIVAQWWSANSALLSGHEYAEFITALDDLLFTLDDPLVLSSLEQVSAKIQQRAVQAKYFQNPENLAYIDKLQRYIEGQDVVGKSNSVVDLIKTVYRELTGDQANYRIPESAAAVAQTLLSYQGSHRPDDLWHFVTPDYTDALIWVQLTSGDNQDVEAMVSAVQEYLVTNPLPQNVSLDWAGLTYINVLWQDEMVSGMLESLLGSFVIVFVVMVVLFRSFFWGVLAMVPLSITITFIYGVIGLSGKDYDMPIAVLSSLTLGLSVDFAIHFLERSRALYKQNGSIQETMALMFDEPARAITRNALVISLGFTPLLLAPLIPYNTVGVFLAVIMIVSCAVSLMVLPVLLSLGRKLLFRIS
ncbi:HAE3 family [Oleiphilus messinensis]|uniref:HAE3 family n=2 Tax=Oleiphilus messinensis TaxID=141451 RepID=A0A1Y0IC89_9GAMM|nr:HAE3 family [Oleiphilus messinensis]